MKSSLICCLALWCLSLVGRAEEAPAKVSTNLPGAFGVVFGKPLPPKIVTYTMDSDLEVAVQIKPPTPTPYLNRYFAKINPATKAVYELQGWFETADEAQKTEMFGKLADALASKYGPLSQGSEPDTVRTKEVDGVTIDLTIIKQSVVLTYTSNSQKKLADKALGDRIADRTKKNVNATGL